MARKPGRLAIHPRSAKEVRIIEEVFRDVPTANLERFGGTIVADTDEATLAKLKAAHLMLTPEYLSEGVDDPRAKYGAVVGALAALDKTGIVSGLASVVAAGARLAGLGGSAAEREIAALHAPRRKAQSAKLMNRIEERGKQYATAFAESSTAATYGGAVPETPVYVVRFKRALGEQDLKELETRGLELLPHFPADSFRVVMTMEQTRDVGALKFIASVTPYGLADTVDPDLARQIAAGDAPRAKLAADFDDDRPKGERFHVVLHRAADYDRVRSIIEASEGAKVVGASAKALVIRFEAGINDPLLATLACEGGVKYLSKYKVSSLYCDRARALIGADVVLYDPGLGLTGAGQTVAAFDSGVAEHDDLPANRVQRLPGPDSNRSEFDTLGHGTHVAGIIAGGADGWAPPAKAPAGGQPFCGVAPRAKLISYNVVDDGVPDIPVDFADWLAPAYAAGARIMNLSLGVALEGNYDIGSKSIDAFVFEHPDALVVIAAGNDGRAPNGKYEMRTVGSPASAKSAVTVGASVTDRKFEKPRTWGEYSQDRFKAPMKDEPMYGDDFPAAISSRGPTAYDSVKPDLLAPGSYIYSTIPPDDQREPGLFQKWPPTPNLGDRYGYVGGTSMAAPVVAGAAALLREYLDTYRQTPAPSAALLKTMLICATHRIASDAFCRLGPQGVGFPDFHQGFGRLDLRLILPHADAPPGRKLLFVDAPTQGPDALTAHAAIGSNQFQRRFSFTIPAGARSPLRAVLAWTDHPGNGAQNNLQLEITRPDNSPLFGNEDHLYLRTPEMDERFGEPYRPPDKLNTVEQIFLENPQPGQYFVRVFAYNTPYNPQGFALCMCGEFAENELTPVAF